MHVSEQIIVPGENSVILFRVMYHVKGITIFYTMS